MAYIYKSQQTLCTDDLCRCDHDVLRDVFIMAKKHAEPEAITKWLEFERDHPADARLVVADVEATVTKTRKANRKASNMLLGKARKPKPAPRRSPQATADYLAELQRLMPVIQATVQTEAEALVDDGDPVRRKWQQERREGRHQ